jgi:hypothetical protein
LDITVSKACTDPADAAAAIQHEAQVTGASILFMGAQTIPSPMNPWSVNCIAKLPNLRLITSAPWQGSMAAAFAIT